MYNKISPDSLKADNGGESVFGGVRGFLTKHREFYFLQVFGGGGVILHKTVEAQGFPLDLNVGSKENSKVNILIRCRINQT